VDGPAASGKSTIARGLASALAFKYINSGALYRAIGYYSLREMTDLSNSRIRADFLDGLTFGVESHRYRINGEDITEYLNTHEASVQASVVARMPEVREKVNLELRRLACDDMCVVEGRDIGTVVFPDAELKVYLEATLEERARRRLLDYEAQQAGRSLDEISQELADRDSVDASRTIAPLKKPEGAISVNSTDMTPEEVIDHLLTLVHEKCAAVQRPEGEAVEGSG